MRKLLIGLIATCLLVTQANADSGSQKRDNCKAMAGLANAVMTARQEGVSVVELLEVTKTDNDLANEYTRVLIEVAYNSPRFNTEYYKLKEITEYEAAAYLSCINDFQSLN